MTTIHFNTILKSPSLPYLLQPKRVKNKNNFRGTTENTPQGHDNIHTEKPSHHKFITCAEGLSNERGSANPIKRVHRKINQQRRV